MVSSNREIFLTGTEVGARLPNRLQDTRDEWCISSNLSGWRSLTNILLVCRSYCFVFVTAHTRLGSHMHLCQGCMVLLSSVRALCERRWASPVKIAKLLVLLRLVYQALFLAFWVVALISVTQCVQTFWTNRRNTLQKPINEHSSVCVVGVIKSCIPPVVWWVTSSRPGRIAWPR